MARDTAPARRRLTWRKRRSERGVALIMVLGSLTVLTIMLTEFQDETSVEFGSALAERDALKAEYAARSAINLSRLLIAAEPTVRRSLGIVLGLLFQGKAPQIPVWELAGDMLGAFNDEAGRSNFAAFASVDLTQSKSLGLNEAGFTVQIVDEDSKINVNRAARPGAFAQLQVPTDLLGLFVGPQYNEFFENSDTEGQYSDRQTICGAIIDWTDSDQELNNCDPFSSAPPASAPEDSFYQLLNRPYDRKNAAFDSLEELHLVRGISDAFWSTFVEPEPDDHEARILTVWGQDQLNVNTANARTIWSWVCGKAPEATLCNDPEQAALFLGALRLVQSFPAVPLFGSAQVFVRSMKGQGPFGSILQQFGVEPVVFKSDNEAAKGVTVESKVFSIIATGTVKAGKRETTVRIHAVVDFRGAPQPQDLLQVATEALGQEGALPESVPLGSDGPSGPEGSTEEGITAVLRPNPGGSILYYRVN